MRIERTREIAGKATTEIACFVTSLTTAEAGLARLPDLSRVLWGIENKLHWRGDISRNEDRCRGRATATSVPGTRGTFAASPESAILAVTVRVL